MFTGRRDRDVNDVTRTQGRKIRRCYTSVETDVLMAALVLIRHRFRRGSVDVVTSNQRLVFMKSSISKGDWRLNTSGREMRLPAQDRPGKGCDAGVWKGG